MDNTGKSIMPLSVSCVNISGYSILIIPGLNPESLIKALVNINAVNFSILSYSCANIFTYYDCGANIKCRHFELTRLY